MVNILTNQETNLIESITRVYGQVSFEYDAVMELIQENRKFRFETDDFTEYPDIKTRDFSSAGSPERDEAV